MVATIPGEGDRPVFHVVDPPPRAGAILLRARQDLDLETVPPARAELAALLADPATPPSVLLHLGADRFVDIRGLRLLVDAAQRARRRGGELVLVAVPRGLRSMAACLDLDDELSLQDRAGGR